MPRSSTPHQAASQGGIYCTGGWEYKLLCWTHQTLQLAATFSEWWQVYRFPKEILHLLKCVPGRISPLAGSGIRIWPGGVKRGGGVGMLRCGGGGAKLDHVGQWSRLPAWYLPRPGHCPDTAHSTTHCCHTASSANMGTLTSTRHDYHVSMQCIELRKYWHTFLFMSCAVMEALFLPTLQCRYWVSWCGLGACKCFIWAIIPVHCYGCYHRYLLSRC